MHAIQPIELFGKGPFSPCVHMLVRKIGRGKERKREKEKKVNLLFSISARKKKVAIQPKVLVMKGFLTKSERKERCRG